MKKLSKSEAENQIHEFFSNIKDKTPKEINKTKKLAMNHNIALGNLRKKFCKKCFSPYKNSKIRIKDNIKSVTCENCGHVSRWEIR